MGVLDFWNTNEDSSAADWCGIEVAGWVSTDAGEVEHASDIMLAIQALFYIKHCGRGDWFDIPYPCEKGPMGGAPYIGPKLGGGPIFQVSVSQLDAKERPGKLPTRSS
jgi:hypothetical protein